LRMPVEKIKKKRKNQGQVRALGGGTKKEFWKKAR